MKLDTEKILKNKNYCESLFKKEDTKRRQIQIIPKIYDKVHK